MSNTAILGAVPGTTVGLAFFSYLTAGTDRLATIGTALNCGSSAELTARCAKQRHRNTSLLWNIFRVLIMYYALAAKELDMRVGGKAFLVWLCCKE